MIISIVFRRIEYSYHDTLDANVLQSVTTGFETMAFVPVAIMAMETVYRIKYVMDDPPAPTTPTTPTNPTNPTNPTTPSTLGTEW